jgi:hypothetical protein
MTKRKQDGATWSAVKGIVSEMDHKQLVKLLSDLYNLSKENKRFFHARFAVGKDPLGPYKKTIEECMYPDVRTNKPIRISKAKAAISSYSKAVVDPLGETELMTFFVECGNSFTVEFGDIDEDFYYSLNLMYKRVIDKVLSLPEVHREDFKERLLEIMESSGNIGWGYHDALCADYSEAFPDDEDYNEGPPDDCTK